MHSPHGLGSKSAAVSWRSVLGVLGALGCGDLWSTGSCHWGMGTLGDWGSREIIITLLQYQSVLQITINSPSSSIVGSNINGPPDASSMDARRFSSVASASPRGRGYSSSWGGVKAFIVKMGDSFGLAKASFQNKLRVIFSHIMSRRRFWWYDRLIEKEITLKQRLSKPHT